MPVLRPIREYRLQALFRRRGGIRGWIDPVHLGIIFLANMELGYLTPPVGMNLFLSAYRFGKPIPMVIRSVIPMFIVLLIGVLLITYIPALSTTLPNWFR